MTKFQIGRTYQTRSACDYDTIFSFEVVSRTAQMISFIYCGELKRRRVYVVDGVEHLDPLGKYSMSPVIRADRFSA